ncbi:uncharacterized protein LOC123565435 [Mercenaria mercenaria]|uniref:uncharacterized protein LOC123565435 n=1 Tax=Mercenaria mercenaria TaxID=6596 RepID=UPI00234EA8DF|nr:uncharacterized protein LOC123565435 [Mercenaria mercenaria]
MAHQFHLEKEKYRQWVKAGLGLGYLKEGLAPFCDDVAEQQHKDILDNIKLTKNLPTVTCAQCALRTLKPDHVKIGKNQCPYGQANCNCCYTSGKIACPNNVCGAIYDNIIINHASTPPAPNWKNTQSQQWTGDPWSIAKCFINAPGYDQKTSAADIDCTGLLHVIINNKYFHNHVGCNLAGANVFSKVRQYRNEIFHSSNMELEEADANSYIDDMIAVLQDGKELINRKYAQDAVKKLEALNNEKFIITTENMEKVLGDIREEMENVKKSTEGLATKDDYEDLRRKFSALESVMSEQVKEMKRLKADDSAQKELGRSDYEKSKLDFQRKIVDLYRKSLLQVSAIPLKPERKHCNFNEVYVRPQITLERIDANRIPEETEVQSMSDIFTKAGNPIKSIYVLGDAGSGKTSFCKSLVNCWCMAHNGEPNVEDELDGIKEMKKFEFLFYISLRRFKDVVGIQEMLERQYKSEILNEILNKESTNIIIVFDGLDEWSSKTVTSNQFQTEGLPERGISKDYTVITTSRPWKIETLGITDKEIEQRLNLKGFCRSSVKIMIDKTVPVLNESFSKNNSSSACEEKLNNKAVASMKKIPIMLLQLICLWFDDKLQVSSRCAVYSAMLELFFSWNDKKKKEEEERLFRNMRDMSKDLPDIELPQYLMNMKLCKLYKYLIHELSRLAYETLFTSEKKAFLTFENSVFEELEISNEVKTSCLKLGILSEDGCPSLSASTSDSSLLSFVHKSIQEYLAAVYIAIKFKAHIGSSVDSENPALSGHCALMIKKVFSKCTTLEEILEQANYFIMLCGLEPRIATSISKYIYDIVTRDKRVLEYRRTIDDEYRHTYLISNIQECILNCAEEVQACHRNMQSNFYVGDIFVKSELYYDHIFTCIDKQYISPDSVRSFSVNTFLVKVSLKAVFRYSTKCRLLETIHIDASDQSVKIDDEDIKSICGVIEYNTSTLKSLYVHVYRNGNFKPMYKTIVRCLPDMSHLVALRIRGFIMSHKDFTTLCNFVSGNSHLEQISIFRTRCTPSTDSEYSTDGECSTYLCRMCLKQHKVDLSKQQQLQYLECVVSVTVTRVNFSNLEIFLCRSLNSTNFVKVFDDISTANKLTKFNLGYDRFGSNTESSYHTVTVKLITLLPLLHQLRELTLLEFTFIDNIMKCPSEMKSMESINLFRVKMSLTTWRQFVDSLPLIPLPVRVKALVMCITRDGDEFNPVIRWLREAGGEEPAARQYVRERGELFNVEDKNELDFCFSTRK